jgi:hypothetical protein
LLKASFIISIFGGVPGLLSTVKVMHARLVIGY